MKYIFGFILTMSFLDAKAAIEVYRNQNGCVVKSEKRPPGVVLQADDGHQVETIAYTYDYRSALFNYCEQKSTNINVYHEAQGPRILIICLEHSNERGSFVRGQIEISYTGPDLTTLVISGDFKEGQNWYQGVLIECRDLKRSPLLSVSR